MARITLRQLLDHAAEHGYGVPAFSTRNMEQGLAILDAAWAVDAPVILQVPHGARGGAGELIMARMVAALGAMRPDVPLCLHQDDGDLDAAGAEILPFGFTSVRLAGSRAAKHTGDGDPLAAVRQATDAAHRTGASVEAVLGPLADPARVVDFAARTGVDALALSTETAGSGAALEMLAEIRRRRPATHLALRADAEAPPDALRRGLDHGVRKFDFDVDWRGAASAGVRETGEALRRDPGARRFPKPAMERVKRLCEARFEALGAAGRAPSIRPVPMSELAGLYDSGAAEPDLASYAVAAE